jgi:hypothetical protein
MTEQITDGKGTGFLAGVSNENRLMIAGPTTSKEHHTNVNYQDAYNTIFSVTPTDSTSAFLYIKNECACQLVCEGFNIRCASDEIVRIAIGVIGTPVGGSDIVPANLYAGSSKKAIGTFQQGGAITGVTNGITIGDYYIAGSNDSKFRNFDADIVIPQNQAMSFTALTSAIEISGFLVMWYDHGGGN